MKRFPRTTLLTVVALIVVAAAALWGDRFPALERLASSLGSQLTDEVQATEVAGFESSDLEGILGPAEVLRITDGDTLEIMLNGQEERVRLIGVDAPELYESRKLELDDEDSPLTQAEIQALGDQARDFTEDFIGAQDVYLEAGFEPRDRYGRLLAYVYLPDLDGDWELEGAWYRQLNFEIVRAGWAETLTVEPNSDYAADYREATLEAQDAGRGIWGEGWVDIE